MNLYNKIRLYLFGKRLKKVLLNIHDLSCIEWTAIYFSGFNENHPYRLASKYLTVMWIVNGSNPTKYIVIERNVLSILSECLEKYCEVLAETSLIDEIPNYALEQITASYNEYMETRAKLLKES